MPLLITGAKGPTLWCCRWLSVLSGGSCTLSADPPDSVDGVTATSGVVMLEGPQKKIVK